MIELNIPPKVAVNLLVERMRFECDHRSLAGFYDIGTKLEDLPFVNVKDISLCAAFDLISFLPVGVFTEQSNLYPVVVQSIKSLADVLGFEEFRNFTTRDVATLIRPMKKIVQRYPEQEQFGQN